MVDLSIVTFNIGGGEGTRADKKRIMRQFIDNHRPSILFLQENLWRHDNILQQIKGKLRKDYKSVTHKHMEAAVYYRKVEFSEVDRGLNEKFEDEFNRIDDQERRLDYETFMERASFAVLIDKTIFSRDITMVLVMSWHGENNGQGLDNDTRRGKVRDLLTVLSQVHLRTNLPIILAGDFNIALNDIQDIVNTIDCLRSYDYNLGNRATLIDFFVTTSDVEVSGMEALRNYMSDNMANGKKVFDHDPVEASVDTESYLCRLFSETL